MYQEKHELQCIDNMIAFKIEPFKFFFFTVIVNMKLLLSVSIFKKFY